MTLTDLSRATWTTFFILKRIENWTTSSFSFSKRATFTLQIAIIRLILKKSHIIMKPKAVSPNRKSVFLKPLWFHTIFHDLAGIFFGAKFHGSKIAVFWVKFTISRVSMITWILHSDLITNILTFKVWFTSMKTAKNNDGR